MNSLWHKLSNVGVQYTKNETEAKRIRLLNRIIVIAAIATIFGLVVNAIAGDKTMVIVSLVSFISYFLSFFLNANGYTKKSPHIIIIFAFFLNLSFSSFINPDYGYDFSFLLIPLLAGIFFDDRNTIIAYGLYALLIYILFNAGILYFNGFEFIAKDQITRFLIFLVSIIIIGYIIYFFKKSIAEKEKRVQYLLQKQIEQNEQLKQFTGIVSHDLKSPMRNLSMYSSLLLARKRNELGEDTVEMLEEMKDMAKRGVKLTENLLNYSRAERQEIEIQEVNLNNVIREACQNLRTQLESSKSFINVGELPTVKANHQWMVLLFQNIIGNAIKYQPKENGQLMHQPKVDIIINEMPESTQIIFKDNGIGIAKEQLPKVFDTFKRVHTQTEYEGTGLGLATCKKAIEKMNGSISVESEVGKGSVFTLNLPK